MRLKFKKGVSSIEVMTVVILTIAVMIGFGGYIERSLAGRWKSAGDTFGSGRQYDPRGFGVNCVSGGTMDCYYDQDVRVWVDENRYRSNHCDCTFVKADGTKIQPDYTTHCSSCINNSLCANPPEQ